MLEKESQQDPSLVFHVLFGNSLKAVTVQLQKALDGWATACW